MQDKKDNIKFFLEDFFADKNETKDSYRIELKNNIKTIINSKKHKIFLFTDLEDLMGKTDNRHSLSLSLFFSYRENPDVIKKIIKSTETKLMNKFIHNIFPDTTLKSQHELLLYFSLYSNDFSLIEDIMNKVSDYTRSKICEKLFCEDILNSFNLYSFLSVDTLCNILEKYYIAGSGRDTFSFIQFIIEDDFKNSLKIISSAKNNISLYQYHLFRGIEDMLKLSSFDAEKIFQLIDAFYSNNEMKYTINGFNGALHFFLNKNKEKIFTCSQMKLYQKYYILDLLLSFNSNYLFSFDEEKYPDFVELSEKLKNIQEKNIRFFFNFLTENNNNFEEMRNFLNLDELLLKFSLISGKKDFLDDIKKHSSYVISLQSSAKGSSTDLYPCNHNMETVKNNIHIIEKHVDIEKIVFLFYQHMHLESYFFRSFSALDLFTDKTFNVKTLLKTFENLLLSNEYKNTDVREIFIENNILSNTINDILFESKNLDLDYIIKLNEILYKKKSSLNYGDNNFFMFGGKEIEESLCFLSEIYDKIRTESINDKIDLDIHKNSKKMRI